VIFLREVHLPKDKNSAYPYCVPSIHDIKAITFDRITIFAGSNGSGKSTLLNVLAQKLDAQKTLGNQSGSFHWFVDHCRCEFSRDERQQLIAPDVCKLIKSEDIMNVITNVRKGNDRINKQSSSAKSFADSEAGKVGHTDMFGAGKRDEELTNAERFMRSRWSDYDKANRLENMKKQEHSNGESSIQYFMESLLEENSLYLLDEPENSLSPKLQYELMKLIEDSARFFNCQFIIATHSPFIMSIKGVKIYDLDQLPVKMRKWHELDNMKAYARLFFNYQAEFDEN